MALPKTWNISSVTDLNDALAGAADGDTLFFAAGDYSSVPITISSTINLTFTSANAGVDSDAWLPESEVKLNRITSNGSLTVDGIHVHETVRAGTFLDGGWEAVGVAT